MKGLYNGKEKEIIIEQSEGSIFLTPKGTNKQFWIGSYSFDVNMKVYFQEGVNKITLPISELIDVLKKHPLVSEDEIDIQRKRRLISELITSYKLIN